MICISLTVVVGSNIVRVYFLYSLHEKWFAMEYNADAVRFGVGGGSPSSAGEPLELIREGAARRLDRAWAFRFLTECYLNKSLMSSHRRSNILAKVYGRIRLNEVGNSKKRLARIFSVSTTSAPNEPLNDHVPVHKTLKKMKSKMKKDKFPKFGHKPSPPYVLTSKTVTMYNGDVWTRRQYGIGNSPYWSSENVLTTHGSAAGRDSLWYCWAEP